MGRFGWHSGYLNAQNVQAGDASYSTTQSSVSVTFNDAMRDVPSVLLTNNADTDVWVATRSETGFTADRASTGAAETFSWVAVDDEDN